MSTTRRTVVLLGLLLALLSVTVPSATGDDTGTDADRVLVVGVPGLVWNDVTAAATPELWGLSQRSPLAALSVRAARGTTCVLDGWATLGAGNRARYPGPEEGLPPVPLPQVPLPEEDDQAPERAPDAEQAPEADEPPLDTSLAYCGLQERAAEVALGDPESTVLRTAQDRGTARYGAEPGALGAAVGCAVVSGRAAMLAVAAPGVEVTRVDSRPSDPAALAKILTGCPLSLVTLNQLTFAGEPGMEKTDDGTEPEPRARALTAIDRSLGRLLAAIDELPGDTLLLVAGISEVNDGRPQLHVGIASGPGFTDAGWLTSASTGRAPFAQLIDLAPTALRALGADIPASMNGQPMRVTGDRPALAAAVQELVDANTAATVHHRNVSSFFWITVLVGAVLVGLGMLVLGVRRGRAPVRGRGRGVLRVAALTVAALPVATYLAGLWPWERAGAPVAVLAVAVLVAAVAVGVLAIAGPWRRHRLGPPLLVLAVTLGTLVLDVLTGSTLELDGLLGYDPIVAGRFTGYGNLSFGLLAVSALLLTTALATAVQRRVSAGRARPAAAGTVVGIGLLTVAVIGAPGLGRDFGGVLAAMPGFLLLAMLLARVRVTVLRFLAILVAAVLAVGTVAVLDWLGPPTDRSHLGRFVEQILTGEAWTVISRKAQANVDILLGSPLAWMLPVALVAAVWLARPGGLLRSQDGDTPGRLPVADVVALRAGLVATALSLALGAAANDSGVALPATAAALLVPLLVWLAAAPGERGTEPGVSESGAPHSEQAEGADRVTVVSRGSTDAHA